MELNQRIRLAREYAGYTQKELADRVGISQTAVHKLECGRSRSSRRTVAIAMSCGVDPVWLETGQGEMTANPYEGPASGLEPNIPPRISEDGEVYFTRSRAIRLPLLAWSNVKSWFELSEEGRAKEPETLVSVSPRAHREMIAMRVIDDSMEAEFAEGDLIIIDPTVSPDHNHFVVATFDDKEKATFKKLVIDGNMRYLKPLNNRYPITEIDEDCSILGVVIGKYREY